MGDKSTQQCNQLSCTAATLSERHPDLENEAELFPRTPEKNYPKSLQQALSDKCRWDLEKVLGVRRTFVTLTPLGCQWTVTAIENAI